MRADTRAERGRGASERRDDTVAENMVRRRRWSTGDRVEGGAPASLDMESESCISHPSHTLSPHYLVISRGMVLKEEGINQLSWVNVL